MLPSAFPAHGERVALAELGLGEFPFIAQDVAQHVNSDRHQLVFTAQSLLQQTHRLALHGLRLGQPALDSKNITQIV